MVGLANVNDSNKSILHTAHTLYTPAVNRTHCGIIRSLEQLQITESQSTRTPFQRLYLFLCVLCVHVCVCRTSSVQACMHNRVRLYSIHVWASGAMTILKITSEREQGKGNTSGNLKNHGTASTPFTKTTQLEGGSRQADVRTWQRADPPPPKHKLDTDLIFKSNSDAAWRRWQLYGVVLARQRGRKH